ncbi:hypothetical protein C6499_19100 [Candidatus Poribacteria bacterium]|nr:MAG: hypothetical protein C6499_19100 [Candidatus Poribacteria bacterium]
MLYQKDEVLETYQGFQIVYCHGFADGSAYLVKDGKTVLYGDKGVPAHPRLYPAGSLLRFKNTHDMNDIRKYIDELVERIADLDQLKLDLCLKEEPRFCLGTEKYNLYDAEPDPLRWIVKRKDGRIVKFFDCDDAKCFGEGEGFILCDYESIK